MPKTLKQLAEEALAVQDACNLSGVVLAFGRAIVDLREHVSGGTDDLNAHPICKLWADKIAHLTGTQYVSTDVMTAAYRAVNKIIES